MLNFAHSCKKYFPAICQAKLEPKQSRMQWKEIVLDRNVEVTVPDVESVSSCEISGGVAAYSQFCGSLTSYGLVRFFD